MKWVHDQLRKVNPNYKFTDADIEVMMADAQQSVRNGSGLGNADGWKETGKARANAEQNAYERKALELEESYPKQTPSTPYDRGTDTPAARDSKRTAMDLNAESQERMTEDASVDRVFACNQGRYRKSGIGL